MSVTTAVVLVVAILGLSLSAMATTIVLLVVRGRVDMKRLDTGPGYAHRETLTTPSHAMFDR